MRRAAFLALWRPSGGGFGSDRWDELSAAMEAAGRWTRAADLPDLRAWTDAAEGALPVRVLPHGAGLVFGAIRPAAGATAAPWEDPAAAWDDPPTAARRLCRSAWGAYAALLRGPTGALALFREPTGQQPAYGWTLRSGEGVVASDPMLAPAALSPPDLGLHWERLWRFVAAPSAATDQPLLDGLQGACPGELVWLDHPARSSSVIWTPAAFADGPAPEPAEAAR